MIFMLKRQNNSMTNSILLMIPNREGWHYFAVKILLALLREITSK